MCRNPHNVEGGTCSKCDKEKDEDSDEDRESDNENQDFDVYFEDGGYDGFVKLAPLSKLEECESDDTF